ncbi:hypothetical protein VZO05_03615 [Aggregatilineales bacterium SYSU G02658]
MKPLTLRSLLDDFRLLLILFVSFRFVLLIAYQPFFINGVERGVGVGGDRLYVWLLTSQYAQGLLPFRDWWSEFPPVWYSVTTAFYALLGPSASYDNWSLLLGVLMLVCEAGTLALVWQIGGRLHGKETGAVLAWVYALMIAPVVFMWWNFDSMVTFFSLAALAALIAGQSRASAGWMALGALTKFISFLLFGAIVRFYPLRKATWLIGGALGLFVLAYAPLFVVNSEFALISLTAQFGKPSYQTVWALIDGNYGTGNFGSVESHLTAEGVSEGVEDKNPSAIPGWLRLGLAGLVGLGVFVSVRRFDQLGVVAFFLITLLIFYLQSQGWSPQWLTLIIPLTLLVIPTRDGVFLCVLLSALAFVEYPFIFVRTGATGGLVLPQLQLFTPWVLVVVGRTALLAVIALLCYQRLRQQPNPDLRIV